MSGTNQEGFQGKKVWERRKICNLHIAGEGGMKNALVKQKIHDGKLQARDLLVV